MNRGLRFVHIVCFWCERKILLFRAYLCSKLPCIAQIVSESQYVFFTREQIRWTVLEYVKVDYNGTYSDAANDYIRRQVFGNQQVARNLTVAVGKHEHCDKASLGQYARL